MSNPTENNNGTDAAREALADYKLREIPSHELAKPILDNLRIRAEGGRGEGAIYAAVHDEQLNGSTVNGIDKITLEKAPHR